MKFASHKTSKHNLYILNKTDTQKKIENSVGENSAVFSFNLRKNLFENLDNQRIFVENNQDFLCKRFCNETNFFLLLHKDFENAWVHKKLRAPKYSTLKSLQTYKLNLDKPSLQRSKNCLELAHVIFIRFVLQLKVKQNVLLVNLQLLRIKCCSGCCISI